MKITYLANSASIHTRRWARHFADRGHTVKVLSFADYEIEGVDTVCLPARGGGPRLNILTVLPVVRRLVAKDPPDVLHSHYATSYGLAGTACSFHPFVVTAWGDDVLIDPERSLPYRLLVRWAMSRADLVTSMAVHMTDLIVKRGYAAPRRILTLPFGVDTARFNPSCRRGGSTAPGLMIVSTRHLEAVYDVETLIRAVPAILAPLPEARFYIVGAGDLRPSLERLSTSLGVGHAVAFLGAVDHQRLAGLLGEADIFVSASKSDGNNISLNEAMACGALPVVSDIPANREWIAEGLNGLFFPVGDAARLASQVVSAAYRLEWRRQAAAENWKVIQERGSWERNMRRMEMIYEELMAGSK